MESLKDIFSVIPQPAQLVLATVGFLVVGRQVLSGLLFFVNVFILSGVNLRKYGPLGSWAVVTGASDGLGKEYASQLASKGFNLILVSRTQSKLDMLALVLKERFAGLEVRVLAMDYAKNDLQDFAKLKQLIDGLDIAILINNVGQSHSIPVPFLSTQVGELQDIVKINCLGTLMTSQTVLPAMMQRKRGLVLTMGSFGGWTPTPYLATYSGSKAFLQQWSSSLAAELKPNGIDVYFVLSYLVVSAMSKVRRPSLLIPTASAFVRSALGKVGRGSQAMAYTYTPFWSHALLQWFVENTIGVGNKLTIWYNLKMHQEIRTRALRKAARNAKKE